jgi:hypothetical protein
LRLTKTLLVAACLVVQICSAQDSSKVDRLISFPDKVFGVLDKKTASIEQKLDRQTNRYIDKLQKQEHKLRKKLWRKDSALAKQLFDGADEKYNHLKTSPGNVSKYSSVYSGHLDSLTTALGFLKADGIVPNPALQKSLDQYKELQLRLNASDQVKKYLADREQVLKQEFGKLGMVREVRKYREQVYYYQQQVREYKQMFEDPSKIEAKLLELVAKLPQFNRFFADNSMLGSLFSLPGSTSSSTASVPGLQTRAMVNLALVNQFGTSTAITQQLQQNVQSAQGQLNVLKDKARKFSSGSYGNTDGGDIPGFKPNEQKTKSFFQRLEYGGNIQTQRARYFFPVTSDIAVSLGYKINNKSSAGIGASYKLGWGNNWSSIDVTQQGVGLRSYLDWKFKGSFYLSGGYEQNYNAMINSIDVLKNYSAWQTSGLIGISKKYTVSKKINGDMKLLWDFLSYQQIPKAQPILFRIGYSLK